MNSIIKIEFIFLYSTLILYQATIFMIFFHSFFILCLVKVKKEKNEVEIICILYFNFNFLSKFAFIPFYYIKHYFTERKKTHYMTHYCFNFVLFSKFNLITLNLFCYFLISIAFFIFLIGSVCYNYKH